MAFQRFNPGSNPFPFDSAGSVPALVPLYLPMGTLINNQHQIIYPPQPKRWGFDDFLYHYARTKQHKSLAELRSLIQKASEQNLIALLDDYLNRILDVTHFENEQDRNFFLINTLKVFFKNITKNHLAQLLMRHDERLFKYLLSLKSIPILNLYLSALRDLLNQQAINSQQYVNLVMNREVAALFFHNKELRFAAAFFLKEMMEVIERGLIQWSLGDYLHFLLDFSGLISLGKRESENVGSTLKKWRFQYESEQLSRADYWGCLLMPDMQGRSPLKAVIFLNNFEIAELYFKAISTVGQTDEIESLLSQHFEENVSVLHALAFTGNMLVLELYVNLLLKNFGAVKAGAFLVKQACSEDAYGQRPYYKKGKGLEPMNYFIDLLQKDLAMEAFAYIEDCRDLSLEEAKTPSPIESAYCFSKPLFFFSASVKSAFEIKEEQEELLDGEAYLPGNLVNALNSPP